MDNPAQLLWGIIFGSIGMGYFIYGKKQKVAMPMICGVLLMVYPYFVTNTLVLILVGIALTAVPYFFRF